MSEIKRTNCRSQKLFALILIVSTSILIRFFLPESIIAQDLSNYHFLSQIVSLGDVYEDLTHMYASQEFVLSFFTSIGFIALNSTLSVFSLETYTYVVVVLVNVSIFKGISRHLQRDKYKIQNDLIAILLIYSMPLFFLYGYAFRQAIAIALFLLLIRKSLKFNIVILLMLSALFHLSTILILPILLTQNIFQNNRALGLLAGALVAYLFFMFAPLYGNIDEKSLSFTGIIVLVVTLLFPACIKMTNAKSIIGYNIGFWLASVSIGVSDLELYRLLPFTILSYVIFYEKFRENIKFYFILQSYLFTSFLIQRNILDAGYV